MKSFFFRFECFNKRYNGIFFHSIKEKNLHQNIYHDGKHTIIPDQKRHPVGDENWFKGKPNIHNLVSENDESSVSHN